MDGCARLNKVCFKIPIVCGDRTEKRQKHPKNTYCFNNFLHSRLTVARATRIQKNPVTELICHYENSIFSPDGVNYENSVFSPDGLTEIESQRMAANMALICSGLIEVQICSSHLL